MQQSSIESERIQEIKARMLQKQQRLLQEQGRNIGTILEVQNSEREGLKKTERLLPLRSQRRIANLSSIIGASQNQSQEINLSEETAPLTNIVIQTSRNPYRVTNYLSRHATEAKASPAILVQDLNETTPFKRTSPKQQPSPCSRFSRHNISYLSSNCGGNLSQGSTILDQKSTILHDSSMQSAAVRRDRLNRSLDKMREKMRLLHEEYQSHLRKKQIIERVIQRDTKKLLTPKHLSLP
ncbi:hypothetical protein FGO68_gene5643 [Halteria grandinella]|uniref:Uncharacterized protein n=1 Tax=Halteria grandinella TaxID=5974 RepID=A0A8J8N962_HALGN|nr:hypothetical protein FGO68_gene5643 [Halteria grandinella]